MGFIFFLMILFFTVLFLGLTVVGNILRIVGRMFGFGQQRQTTGDARQTYQPHDTNEHAAERKKIFDKEEGEYVDFEEIGD
ncbi:MAG: DUF4834 family protein [Prevotellaceae bacterium]|jgi:hypothetical protein|nr:DUF4834 family protein [Prevotellaceae bacterium]